MSENVVVESLADWEGTVAHLPDEGEGSWSEVANTKPHFVFAHWEKGRVKAVVRRGGIGLCAYLGVQQEHPLFGADHEELPLSVHGGLNFSEEGQARMGLDPDRWWFGWSYDHWRDYTAFYDVFEEMVGTPSLVKQNITLQVWTVPAVIVEAEEALEQFLKMTGEGGVGDG